jgi:mannose-6-phosphate isomerase-like protein (cupin superfamily)
MRLLLLFSFVVCLAVNGAAQATQTPRRATPPAPRGGLAITVTDPNKATIPGVTVDVSGPAAATGQTDANGQVSFPGLPAGTYRLRFAGDAVTAFEREVTLRAGQISRLAVTLNPAPVAPPRSEPTPPPPAPAPPAPSLGPVGKPQVLSVIDLIERELVKNNEPRKDTLVACSGNTRSMLVQLNEPQAQRVYEAAESLYYVIAGEGAISVDGRDVPLVAGGYAALPRGAAHSFTRKGRRPLILLAVLSGEPCEQAR